MFQPVKQMSMAPESLGLGTILPVSFTFCFLTVFSWKRLQRSALAQSGSSIGKALCSAKRRVPTGQLAELPRLAGMWSSAGDRQGHVDPQYFFFSPQKSSHSPTIFRLLFPFLSCDTVRRGSFSLRRSNAGFCALTLGWKRKSGSEVVCLSQLLTGLNYQIHSLCGDPLANGYKHVLPTWLIITCRFGPSTVCDWKELCSLWHFH